jgi:hypothetical protein
MLNLEILFLLPVWRRARLTQDLFHAGIPRLQDVHGGQSHKDVLLGHLMGHGSSSELFR